MRKTSTQPSGPRSLRALFRRRGLSARRGAVACGAVVITLLLAVVTACGSGTSGVSTASRTLSVGFNGMVNLNPAKDNLGPQLSIRSLAYAAITHMRADGSLGPGLATSWRYLGTGNTNFEFTLRTDARFADGTPVNAQAVKTWLDYFAKTSKFASAMPLQGIDTVGEWTVQLHLAAPNPIVPQLLSEQYNWGFVASPTAVANPASLDKLTVGAGPYTLDPSATVVGDHYTFVPNKYFSDQSQIRYSKIVARVISDSSAMLQAVRTGQLQVAFGDPSTAGAAVAAGLNVVHAPTDVTSLVLMDRAGKIAKPLSDVRVRQALNYAIDRKAITAGLMGNYGSPSSEVLTSDGFDSAYENFYSYDPDKAKSLLAAAGYANGFSLDVASLGYRGNLGDPVARALGKYLEDVGVKLNISAAKSDAEYTQNVIGGRFPVIQINVATYPMWLMYAFYLSPKGVVNPFGVTDSALDKMWSDGAAAANSADYWTQMSRHITEQAMFLPVFKNEQVWYASKDIGGIAFGSTATVPMASEWFTK